MVGESASDGNTLGLAPGNLVRAVTGPVGQADEAKQFLSALMASTAHDTGVDQREFNVLLDAEAWEEIKRLKDEPDLFATEFGQGPIREAADWCAIEEIFTGSRCIQESKKVHKR